MPVVTEYHGKISYVELSGNLTANELLTSVLKFNRGDKFKQIDIRILDSTLVTNALLDLEKMKAFVAVDKRAFIDNDKLDVIFISTDEGLIGLFKLYADMMSTSPWTFHSVTSIDEAEIICQKSNLSIISSLNL